MKIDKESKDFLNEISCALKYGDYENQQLNALRLDAFITGCENLEK